MTTRHTQTQQKQHNTHNTHNTRHTTHIAQHTTHNTYNTYNTLHSRHTHITQSPQTFKLPKAHVHAPCDPFAAGLALRTPFWTWAFWCPQIITTTDGNGSAKASVFDPSRVSVCSLFTDQGLLARPSVAVVLCAPEARPPTA